MKFTLSWLKDHLETDAHLSEILEALNMIGLEVESVDDRSQFDAFKIAKVLTAEKHPDADKLKVLSVDTGEGKPVQVVCGAPNARAGLIGAFAAPGTYVPGIDVTLSVGNIRGVESHGMMCSERELELSDAHDGIIDLPENTPVGGSFSEYAGLNDPVIEIGITPNRPDALGVAGIARDLEAFGLGKVISPAISRPIGDFASPVNVHIEAEDLCPAFGLRYVRDVKNGPSPQWMQQRLRAIGLRPISALVDITNYVTFDRGRPLHVFDADKVKGDLVVRRANGGETFLGLDGKEYAFTADMCVIADDNGVESLSGIMGGEVSGCTEETVNVLVESALWDPMNIARTGRDLGIITDARYRFERGVDPSFMEPGLDLATNLVTQLCGGEASEAIIAGNVPKPDLILDFPLAETKRLTGLDVPDDEAMDILRSLGFGVSGAGETVQVAVPSWRPDVFGKADIVEEIMRIYGVNRIDPQPLPAHQSVNGKILTTGQIRDRRIRRALASRGMMEAVTWSFISRGDAEHFSGGGIDLALANPISTDMSDMRPSLLPALLRAAQRNADRGTPNVALFEVSHSYENDTPKGQKRMASGVRRGSAILTGGGRHWSGNAQSVSVFDAKADAMAVLEAAGMDAAKLQIVDHEANPSPDWFHPGRSGTIQMGPKMILARFGEIHPLTLEALDISGPIAAFEVMVDTIPAPKQKPTKTKPVLELSGFQLVRRDFAFVMDRDVQATNIIRAASGADKKLISEVTIFDVFEGESLGENRKSVAFEVTLQPMDRTLTDEEIEAVSAKVVAAVEKATGGQLRG